MILTQTMNGSRLGLTITMNTDATVTVSDNVAAFMVTVSLNLEPFMVCVSLIHGYGELQFSTIHVFGENHSTSILTL